MGRRCARLAAPWLDSFQKTMVVSHGGFSTQPCSDKLLKGAGGFPHSSCRPKAAFHKPPNFCPSWRQPTPGSVRVTFLFQPRRTTVGQHGQACIMTAHHTEMEKLPNSPQEENKQRHLHKEQIILAPSICEARHSMMLAPAFSSRYMPYLASVHSALPSRRAKREWHLPSKGMDETNLLIA